MREKETRSGLLMIATKAALAEQELFTARLHGESQRLGNLTIGMAGHLGEVFPALLIETHSFLVICPQQFNRISRPAPIQEIACTISS